MFGRRLPEAFPSWLAKVRLLPELPARHYSIFSAAQV